MIEPDAIVESLASAARGECIPVGVSEGCLTVPSIADAFELAEFASHDGWRVEGNSLRCNHGELDFTVPVIVLA